MLALTGCLETWRPADLQLDITGAGLHDEDRVRVCVEGAGVHTQALGNGRVAVPGLPVGDGRLTLTVDAVQTLEFGDTGEATLVRTGRAGPITLGTDQPFAEAAWVDCTQDLCTPCSSPGQKAPAGAPDQLLAVRFRGLP